MPNKKGFLLVVFLIDRVLFVCTHSEQEANSSLQELNVPNAAISDKDAAIR